MEIAFIRIRDWRSFYGENDIFVSADAEKNVTLIRAENGVGKTSLLAAINWCFFAILPPPSEFEHPDQLVNNFAAEKDGKTTTTVEITFAHHGKRYRAARTYDQSTKSTEPLRLTELNEGGEIPSSVSRPDRFVNSVIPQEMAPHFFFFGESTSRYTGASGARKFGEAVKDILGSTVARMAVEDLTKVMTDYNKQASDKTSTDAQNAEKQIETAKEKIANAQSEVAKLNQEIEAANDRIDRFNQELAGAKPAKEAQARRARLESQLAAKDSEKTKAEARSRGWMQNFATAILSDELVSEANNVIKDEETRRKLPAPYDQKLVDEIIEDELCICGRPVHSGTPEYEKIKTLLDNAGDQAAVTRVMATSNALGRLEEKAKIAWSDFGRNNDDLRRLEGEIRRLDADITEISQELKNNPLENIAEKEAARERTTVQKRQAEGRKTECLASVQAFERERDEVERRRDELIKKSEAARRYVKRAQLAAAITARLQNRLLTEEETARSVIEHEIDQIVRKFMRKPARVKLDMDYQLRLFDERGAEVAKSTGENQLLGLAFTGAIAKYAKERQDSVDDILLPGTVAPLVVDSPFGHLDPVYRRGVAEFLPNLASQVILLVSTSQASDVVMETLAPKIGHEFVLTRHNRMDGEGKPEETVSVHGKSYSLTQYNSEIDGTLIEEVK